MNEKKEYEDVDSLYDFLKAPPRQKEITVPQFGATKLIISRMTKTEYDSAIFSHMNVETGRFTSSYMPGVVLKHLIFPDLRNEKFLTKGKFASPEEAIDALFQLDTVEKIYAEILKLSRTDETVNTAVGIVKNS